MGPQEGRKSLRPLPTVTPLGSSQGGLGVQPGWGGMGGGNGVAFGLWDRAHQMRRCQERPQGA